MITGITDYYTTYFDEQSFTVNRNIKYVEKIMAGRTQRMVTKSRSPKFFNNRYIQFNKFNLKNASSKRNQHRF